MTRQRACALGAPLIALIIIVSAGGRKESGEEFLSFNFRDVSWTGRRHVKVLAK